MHTLTIKCEFSGHHGWLNTDTGVVHFYNIMFTNINKAADFLQNLDQPDDVKDWEPAYVKGYPMIRDTLIDWYYNGKGWYPFKDMAFKNVKLNRLRLR
jgi:hypothetical protein